MCPTLGLLLLILIAACRAAASDYKLSGQIELLQFNRAGVLKLGYSNVFSVAVTSNRWQIQCVYPTHTEVVGFDGQDVITVIPDVTRANRYGADITSGPVPIDASMNVKVLWLALASSDYFAASLTNMLASPWAANPDAGKEFRVVANLTEHNPKLPDRIRFFSPPFYWQIQKEKWEKAAYPKPFDHEFECAQYSADQSTNYQGLQFPLQATLLLSVPKLQPKTLEDMDLVKRWMLLVTEIGPATSQDVVVNPSGELVIVDDRKGSNDTRHLSLPFAGNFSPAPAGKDAERLYVLNNHQGLRTNGPSIQSQIRTYRNNIESTRQQEEERIKTRWHYIFAAAALVALSTLFWISRKWTASA